MVIYRFYVEKNTWSCYLLDTYYQTEVYIQDDSDAFMRYHANHLNTVWIGYGNQAYDQYIAKAILCGYDPYEVSCFLENNDGWEFNKKFQEIQLYTYDTQIKSNHLATIQGYLGRNMSSGDITTLKQDVADILDIFILSINDFNAKLALINHFKLSLKHISKSMTSLSAVILGARQYNSNDEYDVWTPDEAQMNNDEIERFFYRKKVHDEDLEITLNGVQHKLGKGGIHGALDNYHYKCGPDELFVLLDVNHLYPTIMVKYDLLSRGAKFKSRYNWSVGESLRLKNINPIARLPYKDFCNMTYGASGFFHNKLFDPRNRLLTCVYGQCFLVDLIDKLKEISTLVQTNTDGLLIKIKETDFDAIDDIVFDWEQRTGLTMTFEFYDRIHQKDVNNYILIGDEIKTAGAYTKDLSELDCDLPIVNKAVREYFVNEIPVDQTINNETKLIEFQRVINISDKFSGAQYGRDTLYGKSFRVFADKAGAAIQYLKGKKTTKIQNTPDAVRIVNTDISEALVPKWLDKSWYIELAQKRVDDFINKKQKELKVEQGSFW